MGWEKPPRERFVKWDSANGGVDALEGLLTWVSVDSGGRFGPVYNYHLTTPDGENVIATLPKYMDRQVKAEHVGSVVRLEYKGKLVSDNGNEYRSFEYELFVPETTAETRDIETAYAAYGAVPTMAVKPPLPVVND